MYRALRGDYGIYNRSTTQAIGKIVKKFEETAEITNIERPVHHRFARSAEYIAIVSASVVELADFFVLRHTMAYFVFRSIHTSI